MRKRLLMNGVDADRGRQCLAWQTPALVAGALVLFLALSPTIVAAGPIPPCPAESAPLRDGTIPREQTEQMRREQEQREREKARELEQRERERAREQEQRAREQEQRARERARELEQREQERARELGQIQREKAREMDQKTRERARELELRAREQARQHEQMLQRLKEEATETFSKTLSAGKSSLLDLINYSGNIEVRGGPGQEIKMSAVKRVRAMTQEEAKRHLRLVSIDISEAGGRIEVRTRSPHPYMERPRPRNVPDVQTWIDFTITVPSGTAVNVETVSGKLNLSNVKGETRLRSVSGDMVLNQIGHLSLAKSISGNIDISVAQTDGDITAESVSGTVTGKGLKARGLAMGTVSGLLILQEVSCERALIRSVNGDVQFAGKLNSGGRYEFVSHSGDITLAIPAATGFQIDASTFTGEIRSEFPVVVESSGSDNRRRAVHRMLRGTYGDAGALVKVSVFSGNIVVLKK